MSRNRSILGQIVTIDTEKRGTDRIRYGPEIGLEATVSSIYLSLSLSLSFSPSPSFHPLALSFSPSASLAAIFQRRRMPAYTYISARAVRERRAPFQLSIYCGAIEADERAREMLRGLRTAKRERGSARGGGGGPATARHIYWTKCATLPSSRELMQRNMTHDDLKRMRAVRFYAINGEERLDNFYTLSAKYKDRRSFRPEDAYLNHRELLAEGSAKRPGAERVVI